MSFSKTFCSVRHSQVLALILIVGSTTSFGCGRDSPAGPAFTADARLVEPQEGDTLSGRIDLVAEVDLGEPVFRVTFLADGQPIVINTSTPWETYWLPLPRGEGRTYLLHVIAEGATTRASSEPIEIFVAGNAAPSLRIKTTARTGVIERSADRYLEAVACDPEDGPLPLSGVTWTGAALTRPAHGPRLPLALLPPGTHTLCAMVEDLDGVPGTDEFTVTPFDYPTGSDPVDQVQALGKAIRSLDFERLDRLLAGARFRPCGIDGQTWSGSELIEALRRWTTCRAIDDIGWHWKRGSPVSYDRAGRSRRWFRCDGLDFSFARLEGRPDVDCSPEVSTRTGGCSTTPFEVRSRGSTARLDFVRVGSSWILEEWAEEAPESGPSLSVTLLTGEPG